MPSYSHSVPTTEDIARQQASGVQLSQDEETLLAKLRGRIEEFKKVFGQLESRKAIVQHASPEDRNEYNRLISQGNVLNKSIDAITGTIDSVVQKAKGWFEWAFGLDGNPNLGVLPLLPVAAITAFLGLAAKWITDAYVIDRKLSVLERLVEDGMDPERAKQVVKETVTEPSLFGINIDFQKLLIPIVLLGGWWLWNRSR